MYKKRDFQGYGVIIFNKDSRGFGVLVCKHGMGEVGTEYKQVFWDAMVHHCFSSSVGLRF